MKGLVPLFLGLFGTFAFSWLGLTVVPNAQIGHLDPQTDEEGTDVYPRPQSGMVDRGLQIYKANGCMYCHSRWVRAEYAGADQDRKWGDRRSAPRDYLFERPVLLGKMRTGPDLSNVGQRAPLEEENAAAAASPSPGAANAAAPAPSPQVGGAAPSPGQTPAKPAPAPAAGQQNAPAASPAASPAGSPAVGGASPAPGTSPSAVAQAPSSTSSLGSENKPNEAPMYSAPWHHRHLYSPRSVTLDSIMPAYRFLYEKRPITGEPSADALKLTGKDAPPEGWEVVPSYDARCLVAFLLASNQSHPLNEAKPPPGSGAPATPAGSPAAAAGSPAASPAAPGK
jgi:cbb3-type cytochrome oxidase cytochrome c subunit